MSEKTIEELCKEINGKEIIHVSGGLQIKALFLCPPKGEVVSVKPYGYSPEEVATLLESAGFGGYTAEDTNDPTFCLSTYRVDEKGRNVLQRLADIPDNGVHEFNVIIKDFEAEASGREDKNPLAPNPSCPY